MTELGRYIRRFRGTRGLLLREVADRAGCSLSYLARLERGNAANPNIEFLAHLSVALDTDIRTLAEIAADPFRTGRGLAKARREVAGDLIRAHKRKARRQAEQSSEGEEVR